MKNLTPNTILHGDSLEQLKGLPGNSIDMCMTSPPYWALRDYGVERQLGLEQTFDQYINNLCNVFDEIKRVLKDKGTCYVNIGDTYWGGGHGGVTEYNFHPNKTVKSLKQGESSNHIPQVKWTRDYQSKCLVMIPMRFSIEMVNRGWILRNVIIWHKPNCMPSSAKDRFTVDFEYLFFFSKQEKYYFETQYEPYVEDSDMEYRKNLRCGRKYGVKRPYKDNQPLSYQNKPTDTSKGRNKRAVWKIPTRPFKEAHFATYPEKICETPIKAGCPEHTCAQCGKAQREIIEISSRNSFNIRVRDVQAGKIKYVDRKASEKEIREYNRKNYSAKRQPSQRITSEGCNCNAGFVPGIVLDPFFGAGTTGLVALKQKKNFIGIELNPEYIKIANKRLAPYLMQENSELKKAA